MAPVAAEVTKAGAARRRVSLAEASIRKRAVVVFTEERSRTRRGYKMTLPVSEATTCGLKT